MIFRSKIGLEIVIFIAAILGIVTYNLIKANVWQPIIMLFFFVVFFAYLCIAVYYKIENDVLIVNTGLIIKYRININSIIRIKETYNPLSSPALSLDRLEVKYGRFQWILISPKEKELFINEILKINPNIEIKRRK